MNISGYQPELYIVAAVALVLWLVAEWKARQDER